VTFPETMQAIIAERQRQIAKFGDANIGGSGMGDADRVAVMTEELGEVAREVVDLRWLALSPEEVARKRANLKAELVQLAACCVGFLEAMK